MGDATLPRPLPRPATPLGMPGHPDGEAIVVVEEIREPDELGDQGKALKRSMIDVEGPLLSPYPRRSTKQKKAPDGDAK